MVGIGVLGDPKDIVFDVRHGLQQELGDIGEGGGVAGGDFAKGEGLEDLAEDVVDVETGVEITGERGKFLSEFLGELFGVEALLFFLGVKRAKRRMVELAEHAAAATIGEGADTAVVG
jgi:hypothetical protein